MKYEVVLASIFSLLISIECLCFQVGSDHLRKESEKIISKFSNLNQTRIEKSDLNRQAYQLLLKLKSELSQKDHSREIPVLYQKIRKLYVESIKLETRLETEEKRFPATANKRFENSDTSLDEGLRILNSKQAQQLIYAEHPLLNSDELSSIFELVGM